MTEVKIITEETEEKKGVEVEDIKETLKKADEYERLKKETEMLEAMQLRNTEVKAKIALGGKADAGSIDKSQEEKDEEEAAKILSAFEAE